MNAAWTIVFLSLNVIRSSAFISPSQARISTTTLFVPPRHYSTITTPPTKTKNVPPPLPTTTLFSSSQSNDDNDDDDGILIAEGVSYNLMAREWRCKWSEEGDRVSLVMAQEAMNAILEDVKCVPGVVSVRRVVCTDCMDLKVVTELDPDSFASWQKCDFDPEEEFLDMLENIDGVTDIETQTYTVATL